MYRNDENNIGLSIEKLKIIKLSRTMGKINFISSVAPLLEQRSREFLFGRPIITKIMNTLIGI